MLIQNLRVFNAADDTTTSKFHMFSICLVRKDTPVEIDFGESIIYVLVLAVLVLILFSFLIFCVFFRTSHSLIRPLRKLNTKIKEVMVDDEQGNTQSELKVDDDSSKDITELYRVFRDLIQDKQFSQNRFLKNSD